MSIDGNVHHAARATTPATAALMLRRIESKGFLR
jgi:hypothetical protein